MRLFCWFPNRPGVASPNQSRFVARYTRHMRPAACIIAAVPKLTRAILGLRIGAGDGKQRFAWPASGIVD